MLSSSIRASLYCFIFALTGCAPEPGSEASSEAGGGGTGASTGPDGDGTPGAGGSGASGVGGTGDGSGAMGTGAAGMGAGGMGAGGSVLPEPTGDCVSLVTDPNINWRESTLQTDQEIVECLATTLGRPVGYGEKALGGYDPDGKSKLTVITKSGPLSVEEQLLEAISGDDHNWIVFDKVDFADDHEIALYRLHCKDPAVLSHLDATEAECVDHRSWCSNRGYGGEVECLEQFFNRALNEKSLPIRNPVIGSNKTIDGRMSEAYFRFSGFAIGADSSGQPTRTSQSVILTHLRFAGAGHTEDHELDPDMIRSTGASHDIWIHKNEFDLTGDSAFDVKVGAYDITMSFNKVIDVKRAALHGSSDGRVINEQITTTMHHNAFVTRDASYGALGNTGRRVPLIRRGTSHAFDNVFVNYRKDVLSVRVGATVLHEHNVFVVNQAHQEKGSVEASLAELSSNLLRDVDGGNFRAEGTFLWFGDETCSLHATTQTPLTNGSGSVGDLADGYSEASRAAIAAHALAAGQALVDYVSATAGKYGALPFNSPLADSVEDVLAAGRVPCQ